MSGTKSDFPGLFLSQFSGSKQQVKAHAGVSFTIRSHLGSPPALAKTSALIEISEQGEKIIQSRGKRSLTFIPAVGTSVCVELVHKKISLLFF